MPDNLPTIKPNIELTPAALEKFFNNQAEELSIKNKELDLKNKELDLKKQEDDHSFEYAKEALHAQVDDNKDKRNNSHKKRTQKYVFCVVSAIVVTVLICFALHSNHEQVAMEVIKAIAYGGIGGAGGYYAGKSRRSSNDDKNDEDTPLQ